MLVFILVSKMWLIDYGAMHSFASCVFAVHVNRRLESLPVTLLVHTSVGDSVITKHGYRNC